jgi:AhpD family alkylhydroperoxidase
MGKLVEEFNGYREKMNGRIMETANTNIKRFFALDTTTYADGALDVKTKEMLGLVASMVLRCDDCIKYHLGKCHEAGVNSSEMNEVFMIANLVGGSIVIPHYRRAVEYWDELTLSPEL